MSVEYLELIPFFHLWENQFVLPQFLWDFLMPTLYDSSCAIIGGTFHVPTEAPPSAVASLHRL